MSFDKENPEMLSLLENFQQFNLYYLIVGGFAVNRYGYNRTIGFLDIYLKETKANRQNLIYAGKDGLWKIRYVIGCTYYSRVLESDDGRWDVCRLMTDIPGLDKHNFDEYFQMATVDEINGIKVRFLHYNHLLDNKRATNRPKDQLEVLELERINKEN